MMPNPVIVGPGWRQVRLDQELGNWFREIGLGANLPWPTDGPDRAALRPLRAHRDQCVLVRPDRYVAGACNDLASVQTAWAALLQNWQGH